MTAAPDGRVLDVGRRTRTISPALRRALSYRDRTCRFPGCATRVCDGHHVIHWADGGPTSLDNLLLLCRRHHTAVHEQGYRVELEPDGNARFFSPYGHELPASPTQPPVAENPALELAGRLAADDVLVAPWSGTATNIGGGRVDYCVALTVVRGRPCPLDWPGPGARANPRRMDPSDIPWIALGGGEWDPDDQEEPAPLGWDDDEVEEDREPPWNPTDEEMAEFCAPGAGVSAETRARPPQGSFGP
jgi:hypothetical protein